MPYIETRDAENTKLYYKEWGKGNARPVILIHGWPLNADSWDPVTNALANDGCRVIAYDRRGFGRSDQPCGGYNYDQLADDLRAVMEQTDATENAALIGFSMGGGEVARYMSRHGGKGVSQAVLVSSVVPYMLKTDDNPDGVPEKQLKEIAAEVEKDRAAFFQTFLKAFFGVGLISEPVSDELLHHAWIMCMQAGLRPTLECAKAFGFTDFRADLSSFRVPTPVIHGTKVKTVPVEMGRAAAKGIAGAKLAEYDGAPHGLFASHTDRLIEDLKSFLKSGGAVIKSAA
ncbi:MAG: alpha/beta hydrolase [Micavibrio aeruginosavorus]|uniref:Alpha/beta hydrolase n=1 Tax=Micavibrio aeruginosavorus TaxID=349221 RepID=A0A2W4ZNE1_9BACT|nr:MAG: alpha/beta hydrolase [Micavibrio aeruginosavorus]